MKRVTNCAPRVNVTHLFRRAAEDPHGVFSVAEGLRVARRVQVFRVQLLLEQAPKCSCAPECEDDAQSDDPIRPPRHQPTQGLEGTGYSCIGKQEAGSFQQPLALFRVRDGWSPRKCNIRGFGEQRAGPQIILLVH